MRGRITEVIQSYRANPPPLPEDEVTEALQFLEWIAGDNFTLLGIRAYRFPGGDVAADPIEGSGLGILRDPAVQGPAQEPRAGGRSRPRSAPSWPSRRR